MEIFASLSITSGQMSADEIGIQINMQCDKCWAIGDVREKTTIREKKNGWRIIYHAESVDDIRQPINELLNRISSNEEKIKSIAKYCEVLVRCAVYSKDIPSLYFDDYILQKLVKIKASFDIDLYLI